jgi:hypothetical protein
MEKPAVEEVCGVIANLYTNPDPSEKAKANQWLQEFQNSVYAWKVRIGINTNFLMEFAFLISKIYFAGL